MQIESCFAQSLPTSCPKYLPNTVNTRIIVHGDIDLYRHHQNRCAAWKPRNVCSSIKGLATLVIMRSDHYTAAPIPDAHHDDTMEFVDVAIVGGGPGGLSAGVAISTADPSLTIRVRSRLMCFHVDTTW